MQKIFGNWDLGYSLDKHTISSTYIGKDQWGNDDFHTLRTEAGEAVHQLKNRRYDHNQVDELAKQLVDSLGNYFRDASLVIPMPPSKHRISQPVPEIAKQVAVLMDIPYIGNVLVKAAPTPQMKNIPTDERFKILCSAFQINDVLAEGTYNALIVDDIYDTNSSLRAAIAALKQYPKIQRIFVATITRTGKN